ncbi:hypothetical protein M433DRAFT_466104 [Acidomyces richmondensis BFW]|nr:hypothetical protein M433DRAFT_466104 [Acidomyces richmondensis BFW]
MSVPSASHYLAALLFYQAIQHATKLQCPHYWTSFQSCGSFIIEPEQITPKKTTAAPSGRWHCRMYSTYKHDNGQQFQLVMIEGKRHNASSAAVLHGEAQGENACESVLRQHPGQAHVFCLTFWGTRFRCWIRTRAIW